MRRIGFALAALVTLTSARASGESAEFRGSFFDDFQARLDLRAVVADGERSWLKDGFGKTRFGNGDDAEARLAIANAALVWSPQVMAWDLSAHVHAQANPGQYNGVDLVEAFLKWKPVPDGETQVSARAGLFFPPISLEHDGMAWTTTRTLTPSAINSWVGEEVLVVGLEGTARTVIDDHELRLTGALFRGNDTSGTLLTFRGWAMHDVLATAFGDFALPDRNAGWNAFYATQAFTTEPTREVDERYGSYVRLDWSPPFPVSLNVMYYDNHGDPESVEEGQYGWRTRFTNVGLAADLDEKTELLAQYMTGETVMGHFMPPDGWMADLGFESAYVLLAHDFDFGKMAARFDWFAVNDRNYEFIDDNNDEGWAATLAWQKPVNEWARLAAEALYIASDHPARVDQSLAPSQEQFLFQLALQLELK
jgi:hypothetical protein